MKKIILIILVMYTIIACTDTAKRKQEMIDQEVKATVDSYKQKRYKECISAISDSANKIVDSMIVAKMTAIDTSFLSGKPKKPIKPIIKSPLDTTPVKPILQK